MATGLETHDEAGTAYEAYDQQKNRLQIKALGNFACLAEAPTSGDASAVRLNMFDETAHETSWIILVSMPDDDYQGIQRLRNMLVHEPSTNLIAPAFRNAFDQLVELLKSFREASRVRIETPDFAAVWKPADAAITYQAITRVTYEQLRSAHEEPEWTDERNERRCDLVDKEIEGTLTKAERLELEDLQNQMLAYRRKVAPRPIAHARRVHQQLLKEASEQDD